MDHNVLINHKRFVISPVNHLLLFTEILIYEIEFY